MPAHALPGHASQPGRLKPVQTSPAARRAPVTRWTDADEARLADGLNALGVSLPSEHLTQVSRWAALLLQWNRTYNLLGAQDAQTLINEHLLDSLAILPTLQRWLAHDTHPLTDVGTGAGFPGILLAITMPERSIRLVEPIGKKVAFLRQSVLTLGLKNAIVLPGKIEVLEDLLDKQPGPTSRLRQQSRSQTIEDQTLAARVAVEQTGQQAGTQQAGKEQARVQEATAPHTAAGHAHTTAEHTSAAAERTSAAAKHAGGAAQSSHRTTQHFICRAFTALSHFADLCEPYLSDDSLVFAMKAARLSDEQQALSGPVRLVATETVPTLDPDIQRYLAVLKRSTAGVHPEPASPGTPPSPDSATDRRRLA